MFNKLKQYKDLRSQAKSIQETLANETVTAEKGGVKVVMDGNMKIVSLKIGEDLAKESLEGTIADCVNDAIKKTQKLMAQKMQEMGGMPGMQ
jgi:DNA-binding protein YbaB